MRAFAFFVQVTSPHVRSFPSHLGWALLTQYLGNGRLMDPDFLDRLQKISFTEEETLDIAIRGSQRNQTLEECSLSVLGHFLSEKALNLRAAKKLLRSIWKMGDDIKTIEVGEGLLQFKFSLESQLKWVVENGPWSFDNHLLVLKRWQKGMTASRQGRRLVVVLGKFYK